MNKRILLVGSGNMSKEYVKVLKSLEIDFDVVGRSEGGAKRFTDETGVPVISGGLDNFLETNDLGDYGHIIVATNVRQLYPNTAQLIRSGAKSILVEKPCVLKTEEMDTLLDLCAKHNANVFIAYNRRFLSSVIRAKEIIDEDGGLDLVKFDFTEWGHVIQTLDKDPEEKQRWLLANSTHIIDLAFFFSGVPSKLEAFTGGQLDWHPAGQVFTGAGVSPSGTLISYGSDWGSASRWWLELFTPERKLRMCPVETLTETKKGTVVETPVDLVDDLDKRFKPGLYLQTAAFVSGETENLCSIADLSEAFPSYLKIANYE